VSALFISAKKILVVRIKVAALERIQFSLSNIASTQTATRTTAATAALQP
jgi:hypothetical protein